MYQRKENKRTQYGMNVPRNLPLSTRRSLLLESIAFQCTIERWPGHWFAAQMLQAGAYEFILLLDDF